MSAGMQARQGENGMENYKVHVTKNGVGNALRFTAQNPVEAAFQAGISLAVQSLAQSPFLNVGLILTHVNREDFWPKTEQNLLCDFRDNFLVLVEELKG